MGILYSRSIGTLSAKSKYIFPLDNDDVDKIEHKIFKQCLKDFKMTGVEISSVADIPSGTGLGSSS